MAKNPVVNELQIRAMAAPWYEGVEFLIRGIDLAADPRRFAYVTDLIFNSFEAGMKVDPSFVLDYAAAQTLMDDLWQAGLRPTEGTGSAGALRAVERHLADMRRIVAEKLKVKFDG